MKLSSTRAISASVRGLRIAPAGVRAGGTLMRVLPLLSPFYAQQIFCYSSIKCMRRGGFVLWEEPASRIVFHCF